MAATDITEKQKRFADEYLIDLNATQAATRAGYSPRTANEQGARLLANAGVKAYIAKRIKDREQRTEITQDRVLKELAKIGFSDIRKALSWGSEVVCKDAESGEMTISSGVALVDSALVDDDTAAAIAEVSQTQNGIKIKLHDKRGALVDIGRHLGMFKDKVEITGKDGGPVETAQFTRSEYEDIARKVASEV